MTILAELTSDISIIAMATEPTFSSNPTTPQKVRQIAKVTPFEKNEEVSNDIAEDDNLAQEVFMLETNSLDSLDSPPINDIEDNDPLAGLESNNDNENVIAEQTRPNPGFGLRLANFAVDPANISAPEHSNASSTSVNEQTWHIAQGVAPEQPSMPTQYLMPQSSALTRPLMTGEI